MYDDGLAQETVIFEKPPFLLRSIEGRLMVSSSGEIEYGAWKLLRESLFLEIRFGSEGRLLRPLYLDNNLCIFQQNDTNRNLILISEKTALLNELKTKDGLIRYLLSTEKRLIEKDRIKEESRRVQSLSPADREKQKLLEQRERALEQIRVAQLLIRAEREGKHQEYLQNKDNEDYLINEIFKLADKPRTIVFTGPILFGLYAICILIPVGLDLYYNPGLVMGIGLLVTVFLILLIESAFALGYASREKNLRRKLKEDSAFELKQLNWYRALKPKDEWRIKTQYKMIQDLIKLREEKENL